MIKFDDWDLTSPKFARAWMFWNGSPAEAHNIEGKMYVKFDQTLFDHMKSYGIRVEEVEIEK